MYGLYLGLPGNTALPLIPLAPPPCPLDALLAGRHLVGIVGIVDFVDSAPERRAAFAAPFDNTDNPDKIDNTPAPLAPCLQGAILSASSAS